MVDSRKILKKEVTVKTDRELGSKHPKHGYIPNTISGDGEELDAYIIGVFVPVSEFIGECIAIIHRTDDNDDKLVVAPKGINYSDDQIKALTEFQEKWFTSEIIRK